MARTNFDIFVEDAEYNCSNLECQTDWDNPISYPPDMLYFHKGGWYCEYCFDFQLHIERAGYYESWSVAKVVEFTRNQIR